MAEEKSNERKTENERFLDEQKGEGKERRTRGDDQQMQTGLTQDEALERIIKENEKADKRRENSLSLVSMTPGINTK